MADLAMDDGDLVAHFESLGGAGHGSEFGLFQLRHGVEDLGLLGWADLGSDLLILALERRFEGVGDETNTIIFHPDGSDEWWTRDSQYWMAMRSMIKADGKSEAEARPLILQRLRTLRERLIFDLETGRKIFVFRDLFRNLTETMLLRLHAAIRAYGPATLFYLCYADAEHPPGTVEKRGAGLLVGYVAEFAVTRDSRPAGPIDPVFLDLCHKALVLHADPAPAPARPHAAPAQAPDTTTGASPITSQPGAPAEPRRAMRAASRPSRQIVLVGNCQVEAMMWMYRRFVAPRTRDVVAYVPSYESLTDDRRSLLEGADLIVEQVMDLTPNNDARTVAADTPRVRIPLVSGAFLWPFRAQSHPNAVSYPFLQTGPFDAEISDSYLNRLIIAGMETEKAIELYENLDVGKVVNLDRLYDLMIDRQRARDAVTGYGIADLIEAHFRTEYLFLTPYHPNVRISVALATELFRRLGATDDDIARMTALTRVSPFPAGETPIHPAVARHWGLQYIGRDQRYRFRNEGSFTFREHIRRYLHYTWNVRLEEGWWLLRQRRFAEAIAPLRDGVAASPHSAQAHHALAEALGHTGERTQALDAVGVALSMEPANAAILATQGTILRESGQTAEAAAAFRKAIDADPAEMHYCILLAHTLRERGDLQGAADAYEQALRADPWSVMAWRELAGVRERMGDWRGAADALERALEIDDTDVELLESKTRLLMRHGRDGDAVAAAETVVERRPESVHARIALIEALQRQGDAEAALSEALELAVRTPNDGQTYACLGHVLHKQGDLQAAEHAYRRAARLSPENAHYRHTISTLLLQRQRIGEAIAEARAAIDLEPGNALRLGYLADLLCASGDFDQARETLDQAIARMPEHIPFQVTRSDIYAREGRLDDAIAGASAVVQAHPTSAVALGHLAHVEALADRLADADRHLRAALVLAPQDQGLHQQLARLTARMQSEHAA